MKQYVKTSTGLTESNKSHIKTFQSIEALQCAIDNGDLLEGEQWQVDQQAGVTRDISTDVGYLMSVTPSCASVSNWLATIADVTGSAGDILPRVVALETDIATKTSNTDFNALAARVGVNETNITGLTSSKVSCTDYTSCISDINDALDCKVDCSDYTTALSSINSTLTTHGDDISDIQDELPNKASTSSVTSLTSRVTSLEAKPGLDCVGTLVAADIAGLTTCTGTVTSIYDESTNTEYLPNANGQVRMPVYAGTVKAICDVDSAQCFTPDANGVVRLSGLSGGATFTLTGNTLTIDLGD